nr:oligosaccharide flippase family protein [Clostridium hominis]
MNTASRTVNSIRNILTGFLGQFIQTILGFISRTVFIKFLAAEYLGISGLFTNILSILSLAELGVGSAIIYALYKPLAERNEKELTVLMRFYSKTYRIIGIIIGIIGLALMPFLNIIIKNTPNINENIQVLYLFYLFNTVITYFYSYKTSIIIADQKNYISSIVSYLISIVQTILQIFVLVITRNFMVYLSVQAVCSIIYNLIISKIADKMYPFLKSKTKDKLDKKNKASLIKNIKSLMIVKLSGVLVNNTDNMIITYFSGLTSVGMYSNYTLLTGIINTVLSQIFGGITASVGNLNAKESKERQREFFDIMNFANFWLFGFSSICIILLINDVIRVWLSDEYVLPINIAIIVAVNFYMVGMQNAVWTFKNTMGLFGYGRYLLLVTATINLILSIVLGNLLGLFGILLATAIARILTNTWYDPYAVFKYGLGLKASKYFIKYIRYLLIIILSLLISYYLSRFIYVDSTVKLILKIIICAVTSNLVFLVCLFKTREFNYFKTIIFSFYNKTLLKVKESIFI